jgi:inhibitor of cysteine peptidase
MELTQEDSGGHRTARVGDELSVVLPENPTTGYRWHSEIDATTLQPIGDRYQGPTEPRGAAGTRRLTFRILRPGPAHLRVVKRRAWEDTPVEEFGIDLDAEDVSHPQ